MRKRFCRQARTKQRGANRTGDSTLMAPCANSFDELDGCGLEVRNSLPGCRLDDGQEACHLVRLSNWPDLEPQSWDVSQEFERSRYIDEVSF